MAEERREAVVICFQICIFEPLETTQVAIAILVRQL